MVILSPKHQWWHSWFTGNRWSWVWQLWHGDVNTWLWFRWRNVNIDCWGRCRLDSRKGLGRRCWFRLDLRWWNKFPEKLSVAFGNGSGSINTDLITVMGTNLNNNTCLGPLLWIVAMLFLYEYMVTFLERRKLL